MDFTGKAAIVTGASTGMGRAAAVRLAELGAGVVVNYSASEDAARETADLCVKAGGRAALCRADVSREDEADRLVAAAEKEFGRLDALVNNAGFTRFIPFDDLQAANAEIWQKIYAVNVMGPFFCTRAAAPLMRRHGGGAVVNVASVSGHRPSGSCIPYVTSKAALLHMTRALAKTLAPDIRVNTVSPGYIGDTRWQEMRADFDRDRDYAAAAETALAKRVGTPKDVADAVVFLLSDEASYCTGTDLLVDGGRIFNI